MELINRSKAKALGLKRYFTGKPCKHGHVAERVVSGFYCWECHLAHSRAHRFANKEKIAVARRRWYEANRDKDLANQRAYRLANREKIAAARREKAERARERAPV